MNYRQFLDNIKTSFHNLRKPQQYMLIGIAVCVMLVMTIMLFWGGKTEWVVLFPNLNPKEASRIVNELKNQQFDFMTESNGTIKVPAGQKSEIMLTLAGSDVLPDRNVSWEKLFSNSSILGQTKQRERIDYIRGMQGELEYTINKIDQVKSSRVHINIPAEKLFKEDELDPTASVLLKLVPFEELTTENIRAIQNMVAYSVEGLSPVNVKVTDTSGKILSDEVDYAKDEASKTMTILQIQQEYEEDLSNKAGKMLEKILGAENARVEVAVEFDFDKIETTIKKYSPPIPGEENGIIRSQEKEEEKYEGTGRFPGGVPGTDSNVPGYKEIEGDSSKYNREKTINNFEINTEDKHLIKKPGTVKRLTIAVFLNDKTKLTDEQKLGLEEGVKNAVGFNSQRGDKISLMQIHFDNEWFEKMVREMERRERMKLIIIISSIGGILLIIIAVLVIRWYRNYIEAKRRKSMEQEEIKQVVEIEEEFEPILSIEEQEKREMHEKIRKSAQSNPEEFAKLLKAWMMEE